MSEVSDRLAEAERGARWGWFLATGASEVRSPLWIVAPHDAGAAADQTWSPFVLVTGLVLIGLVAEGDGVFQAVGGQLARFGGNGMVRFLGSAVLIAIVTATLNLDTSVVFVTPVLLAAARHSGSGERPLLYGSIPCWPTPAGCSSRKLEPHQSYRARPWPTLGEYSVALGAGPRHVQARGYGRLPRLLGPAR